MSRIRLSARKLEAFLDEHRRICHLCGGLIGPGQAWQRSHPIPLAAGGTDTPDNWRPAHERCHAKQTAEVDAGLIAKVRRQRQKHVGAKPRSRNPIPGSRNSPWKRRMDGRTERRTP